MGSSHRCSSDTYGPRRVADGRHGRGLDAAGRARCDDHSENTVGQQVSKLSAASVSLVGNGQVPPAGVKGPQRSVTRTFPSGSAVSTFRIEGRPGNCSVLRYRPEGATEQRTTIEAPIVNSTFGNTTSLRGSGERALASDYNETSVVVVSRA